MENEKKFLVDSMLGSLARWLRIIGYDTIYWIGEDKDLLEKASLEKRIILTKDKNLHSQAIKNNIKAILIKNNDIVSIFRQLILEIGINVKINFGKTRCPLCNSLLIMDKNSIKKIWNCPSCGKKYWIGKHWRSIERMLKTLERELTFKL
ncbi:MAG: Mut7-C RNAse domain-containing protein [Candidatus Aenigmatarchaeota archaeon]